MGLHLGGGGKGGGGFTDNGGVHSSTIENGRIDIATRSLLDLYEGSERAPGARVRMCWWEQSGINLAGAWGAASEAAEAEEDRVEE